MLPGYETDAISRLHPIAIPPGRNGMQPDVAISYSSSRANGWVGVGWDVGVSTIEVETRFGVPTYESDNETYVFNGAAIVCQPAVGGVRICQRRVEGSFDRIERFGQYPNQLHWVVTGRDGTLRLTASPRSG